MKALVIGSGEFYFPFDKTDIKEYYIIACDGGLDHCRKNGIDPDKILGDFDSVTPETLEAYKDREKTVYPVKKDMTDLELGIRLAVELGADDITVTGALSSARFDHSLCNISLLLICLKKGIKARVINKNNTVFLVDDRCTIENEGRYVSFLAVTPKVEGLTLKGFEYPLDGFTLEQGTSLCISNRIAEKEGMVSVGSGVLAVITAID